MPWWKRQTFGRKLWDQWNNFAFRSQVVPLDAIDFKTFAPPDPKRVVLIIPPPFGALGSIILRPLEGTLGTGFQLSNTAQDPLIFDVDHQYVVPQKGMAAKVSSGTANLEFWEVLYIGG